ncbi:MAG: ESPR-type extended signal peptide-containing protein, partial [Dialister invisus]|uniref:ESPR-type extended signal peptide-containing protein n=1 Tax=Dialister invisus TaxID=218538 RepID=UPI003993D39E
MNRIYKVVWSKAKGCYVVVSELAKQNGKNKYGQTGETTGLLSALLCALMLTGSALFWPMEVSAGTQYGDDSWADGYNTAIGISARARGDGALALGTQTKATSIRSTAIGHQAEASGADSISIGTLSGASNTHSIAIGEKARAYGIDAIAFGASANATATNSMAVGRNARSTAGGSVAVGINTEVTQINSVAMGATAKAYGDSAVSLGVDVVSRGHSAVAVGANADALAQSAVSIGDSTLANAHNAVSVGISSQATAERAIAMGDSTRATAWDGVAIGTAAKANATGAVAIGKDALANQEAGTAVGIGAEATGQYAAAFGDVAKASVRWGTAIGTGSLANVAAGAVGYDPSGAFHSDDTTGTWKSTLGAVAVGDTTRNKTRQIIGVAAGTNDTDAVNVAQLKAAQLGGGGDSSWVIQDTNSPQGRKTIDKNNPLTVRGDRYIKAEVGYDGLNLKLDENQLNNSISNNSTVQNNRTDINNLKSGFNLKAGSATSQVRLGEGTTPTIEFATADDTMTVNLSDKKVTYGIDKNKLINNINNTTNNPVTNIKAQFGVTADSGSQKTVTLTKDTTPTVKFKGDGKYLTSVTDTDGVQYSVDENKLNQNITNITNEAIKGKGLYFGANSGATVLNKLGSTVKIQGEGTKADSEYSGENIKTKVSQDASGNTNINMMLASALNGITSISNGKAGSNNTTITLGDGTVNVGGSTISNVKSALNGTALANASEDQKKSAATIGDLKDAVNNMSGDVNWVIQDANTPKGTKTINSTTPLTVKGDKYVKTTVNNDGLSLGLDEDQLNNTITNNNTVQNNKTDISNLKAGFNLKAGATTSQVKLGEATTPTIEFATADDTMTVNLSDKKVTYGIDKNKLINNINNTTNNPVTNIKAQFGVTADSGSQKTVTLTKDTTPTVKFKGDGKYLTSVTDTDGVQYSVDENKLNQNITNITNEAIKGKGLYFGANSGATVLNKLGSTVKIQGEGTKADSEYSGKNVKTKVSQDASGNTIIDVMLDKELSADKVIVGKAGADGKDGVIGVNGKDGVSGVGINGKDGISVKGDKGEVGINGNDGISIKGKDGKDAVTINGKDGVPGVDGKEGHIGLNGKDGITDIWTRPGQPGLNGANGTTMTRVVYKDPKGNEHEVATLDDGLKFAGDDGQTDKSKVIAKLLNKTMDIVGGADNTKLTDGNIGVNNVNGKLQVQLASALNGITSISNGKAGSNNTTITLGDGTVNVGGSTISNVKSALNGTALANASEDQKKSAATIGDLKDAVNN